MLSKLLPYWKPTALALSCLIVFWLGWHARAVTEEAMLAKRLQREIQARNVAEERARAITKQAEADLSAIRERNRNNTKKAAHESAKPAYQSVLPDAGRLLYNDSCC